MPDYFERQLGRSSLSVPSSLRSATSLSATSAAQPSRLPLGMVDASIVAVAERLGLSTIATLNQRHFTVVRPRHVDAFTLTPI